MIYEGREFWGEMEIKYPKAMGQFKGWFEEYKLRNNWELLFNQGIQEVFCEDGKSTYFKAAPPFQHIPIALQFGIFVEWVYSISDFTIRIRTYDGTSLQGWCEDHVPLLLKHMEKYLCHQ